MSAADIPFLLLRGAVGGTMIVHGVRHGRTLKGTARWFDSIGFRQPGLQARTSAVVEVGSGAALLLGAATPLAASAVVGTMAVAARSVHAKNGFFITSEGYEYVLNLSAAAVAIGALGPGAISVDRLLFGQREWFTPLQRTVLTLGLGLAGAAAQLAVFWREPPAHRTDIPAVVSVDD
jgi:putative oxidoreductase